MGVYEGKREKGEETEERGLFTRLILFSPGVFT